MLSEIIGIVIAVVGLGFTALSAILLPFAFVRCIFSLFAAGDAVEAYFDEVDGVKPEKPEKPKKKPAKQSSKPVVDTYDEKFKLPANPFA
jgi:hypothetical protein